MRHSSWFDDQIVDFLKENDISLVWSVRDNLEIPSLITSDQMYVRFLGDRSIADENFGKIVKNRS